MRNAIKDGLAQPFSHSGFSNILKQHDSRKEGRYGICRMLPGQGRSAAMNRLEDSGLDTYIP
jgi:hypothetical protein